MGPSDTIFALSSGAPPAAIAIVRISGPAALAIASALAGELPKPRHAALRALRDPRGGALLDRALVLLFPGPHSATGEDLVELHLHGGRAVVAAVEAAIAADPRARHADAGEFTRRALEHGVIDLTAAEGLGDLLSAQTEGQRRAALAMAEGGVSALVAGWTEALIGIAAAIEAQLDFSDEDDVAAHAGSVGQIAVEIERLVSEIGQTLAAPSVERLNTGISIVIAGPPNSGKSTLINRLVERDVAIVSPISGTTRDRIEAGIVREGISYIVSDTAGLTDTPGDEIERIGIARAMSAVRVADIVLWLGDDPPAPDLNAIVVHARCDQSARMEVPSRADIAVSALTGVGIDTLWGRIKQRSQQLLPHDDIVAVNRRQHALLVDCVTHLRAAVDGAPDLLVVAEEVRAAVRSLDIVTGRAGVENLLDEIFARFCIGK